MTNSTTLVIEPTLTGHRFGYLEWVTDALRSTGTKIIVVSENTNCDDYRLDRLRAMNGVEILLYDRMDPTTPFTKIPNFTQYLWIKSAYRRVTKIENRKVDAVFLPYLDYVCYLSPLFGHISDSTPLCGILMTPYFHLMTGEGWRANVGAKIKQWLFEIFLARPTVIEPLTIDKLLSEKYSESNTPLKYLRDPSSFAQINAPATEDRSARKTILVYGSIAMRKGIAELLEAYASSDLKVILTITIAGKQDQQARAYLHKFMLSHPELRSDVTVIERFLTAEDEVALFTSADIVWVGYISFYNMSGVIVQAGMAKKPILASRYGLIGELTRQYKFGVTVDVRDQHDVVTGLRKLSNPEFASECGRNGYTQFMNHTVEAFKATVSSAYMQLELENP